MFNKIKKSFTIALAVVMAFASVAACATGALQRDARVVGYDVDWYNANRPTNIIPIQYQVYDEKGVMIAETQGEAALRDFGLEPFATAELKNPWVSIDFGWAQNPQTGAWDIPLWNQEYADLYANGNKVAGASYATGRAGVLAGVKYRNVDYMWEAAAPHKIYSRTQAYLFVNGVAQWYSNATYPVQYSGRNAQVKAERIYYGFGDYKVTGKDAIALLPTYMAPWVGNDVFAGIEGITAADLAPKTEVVRQDVTAYFDEIKVPKSYDIKLVGPGFDGEGNQIPDAKTIIGSDITTVNPANLGINDVIGVVRDSFYGNIEYAEITWTNSNHEAVYPYNDYLFLTVDGVVMDGRMEAPGYYRPCIFRYKTYFCAHCGVEHVANSHVNASTTTTDLVDYVDGVKLFNDALN